MAFWESEPGHEENPSGKPDRRQRIKCCCRSAFGGHSIGTLTGDIAMEQSPHGRDMSMLVGTSKTLERAISGLQMSADRLARLLDEDAVHQPHSPGISKLIEALRSLTADDQAVVNGILTGRGKPKRKHK
jgi:hypothetical protein